MTGGAIRQEPSPFVLSVGSMSPGDHRDFSFAGSSPVVLDSGRVEDEVSVTVKVSALSDGVVADGTGSFQATLVCHRCLAETSDEHSIEFMQVFRAVPDEDGRQLDSDGNIDLEPVVRDEVVLDLPLAPLCRPECLGLCSVCGTDLNSDPCSGHTDESDHPLAALRQLLDPQDT